MEAREAVRLALYTATSASEKKHQLMYTMRVGAFFGLSVMPAHTFNYNNDNKQSIELDLPLCRSVPKQNHKALATVPTKYGPLDFSVILTARATSTMAEMTPTHTLVLNGPRKLPKRVAPGLGFLYKNAMCSTKYGNMVKLMTCARSYFTDKAAHTKSASYRMETNNISPTFSE